MKFINGVRIIKEVLDSYNEYEILPPDSQQLLLRLIDDLKYNRKIQKQSLKHFKEYFPHLFEETSQK